MSRSTRHEIRPATAGRRKVTKREAAALLAREIKRRLISAGQMLNPALAGPKFTFAWSVGDSRGVGGMVDANTTGEARALIKKRLGLKKRDTLPHVVKIERFERDKPASIGSGEVGAV
jgi:hypothetical protein